MDRTLEEIRAQLREMMPELSERYNVESLSLFGSHVRGTRGRTVTWTCW